MELELMDKHAVQINHVIHQLGPSHQLAYNYQFDLLKLLVQPYFFFIIIIYKH